MIRCFHTYLLKLNRSLSKTRTGPVLLKMVSGWPAKRQKMAPETAVPRKLSSTPWKEGKHRCSSVRCYEYLTKHHKEDEDRHQLLHSFLFQGLDCCKELQWYMDGKRWRLFTKTYQLTLLSRRQLCQPVTCWRNMWFFSLKLSSMFVLTLFYFKAGIQKELCFTHKTLCFS